jgi:hypothetical protein
VSILDEATPQAEIRVNGTDRSVARKDKGKGKEKEKGVTNGNSTEEPLAITYNLNDFGPPLVRFAIYSYSSSSLRLRKLRRMKITVRPANLSVP